MNNPIEILMIDDDEDNFHSYKNIAAKNRVILKYESNLIAGIKLLRESKKITGVILDGKGFINPDQQRGSDKEDFVHQALTDLAILEKEQNRYIPKCVLTAWYDKLVDSLESRVKIYDKKTVKPEEMFSYLKEEVYNSDIYKTRKDFINVFEAIERINLPAVNDQRIYNALKSMKSGQIQKSDFNNLRDIFESILIILNTDQKKILPDNLFHTDGRPNLEFCVRYLAGNQIGHAPEILYPKGPRKAPEHIVSLFGYIKEVTSIFSHAYTERWNNYLFGSVLFGLCEIILWTDNLLSN